MPYIRQERRDLILQKFTNYVGISKLIVASEIMNAGELNYAITELILEYFKNSPTNYQTLNDVVGALESAKTEFQRRIVSHYEDKKIQENGDVYPQKKE